jgi:hypothetical protein
MEQHQCAASSVCASPSTAGQSMATDTGDQRLRTALLEIMMGMQPDMCYHGAPGHGCAFWPAPGAASGAGGQGGRRIPEGRIAGATIRDRGGGGVAAAMAEQISSSAGSGTAPEAGRSLYCPNVHNPAHLDSTDAGRSYCTEFSKKRAHWQSVRTNCTRTLRCGATRTTCCCLIYLTHSRGESTAWSLLSPRSSTPCALLVFRTPPLG